MKKRNRSIRISLAACPTEDQTCTTYKHLALTIRSETTLNSAGSRISLRGRRHRRGGTDSQGSYISKILYVKMKESGPLGGRVPGNCQCRPTTGMLPYLEPTN